MAFNNVNDIQLVISDMDGVAFSEKNFYRHLQVSLDFDAAGYAFYKQQLAGGATYGECYQEWSKTFLTGLDATKYHELINSREYSKCYEDFLNFSHLNGAKTVLVTSGPDDLASRAIKELVSGHHTRLIDEFYANTMEIQDGKFTGRSFVMVDDKDKSACITDLIEENKGHILSIGDGEPDIQIAKHADIVIAYNSQCKELNDMADLVLPNGRLSLAKIAFTMEKSALKNAKQHILKKYAHEFIV